MKHSRFTAALSGLVLSATLIAPIAHAEEAAPATAATQATQFTPSYPATTVPYAETATIAVGGNLPAGTTFKVAAPPKGWDFSVNAHGTLTVTPDAERYAGSRLTLPVLVQYPDRSYEYATAVITVGEPSNPTMNSVDLSYPDTTVEVGKPVTIAPTGTYPAGTRFYINDDPIGRWQLAGNAETGEIQVTAGQGSLPGSHLAMTVIAVYPDQSKDTTTFTITVGQPSNPVANASDFSYDNVSVRAGETITVKPKTALPAGTRVIGPDTSASRWDYRVAEDGTISLTGANLYPGSRLRVGLIAIFPDGSQKETEVAFTIAK